MSVTMAFGLLTTFIGGYFYSRVKMDEKNAVNYAPVPGSEDEASSTIGSFCSTHKWKTCSTHKWKPSERKYALCAIAVVVGVLALFTLNEVKPERVRSNGPFASSGGLVNYSMFSMNVSIGELKNRIETIKGDIQAGNFTHASELLGMENALPNITATSVSARITSETKVKAPAEKVEAGRTLTPTLRPTLTPTLTPMLTPTEQPTPTTPIAVSTVALIVSPTHVEPGFKDSKLSEAFKVLPGDVQVQVIDLNKMFNNTKSYIKMLQSKNGTLPWNLGNKAPKQKIKLVKPDYWIEPAWHGRIFLPGDYHCREGLDVHIEFYKDGLEDADIILNDMVHESKYYKTLMDSGFKKSSHQTLIPFGVESVQHWPGMWPYASFKRLWPQVDLISTIRYKLLLEFLPPLFASLAFTVSTGLSRC